MAGVLTVSILAGCGDIDDTDEPVPVNFVSATPPDGEISPLGTITVTFDNTPVDLTVSHGTVTGGKTAFISGPFTPGPLALTLTWADGIQKLTYTVLGPCCAPLTITGGTVEDGDTDVDPELINSDGKIEIVFDEDVYDGNIALQTEGGDDVGWIGKIEGNKATLELVKGRELTTETTYVIKGKISDAAGNRIEVSVTFVTKGKA